MSTCPIPAPRWSYAGAASLTSATASSSFTLDGADSQPSDLVTDGARIWVCDAGTHQVFVYSLTGTLLGRWDLDSRNANPSGITLNPAGGSDLWLVDRQDLLIYHYPGGRSQTSGSLTASGTLALAAGQGRPEGIADPPVASSASDFWLAFPSRSLTVNDPSSQPLQTYQLHLYLQSATATTGYVAIPGFFARAFEVTPGKITEVAVPQSAALGSGTDTVYPGMGIHISAGAAVSVVAMDHGRASTDSYLALPTESMGTEYVVPAWNNYSGYYNGPSGTQLAVLASENDTQLTITPTVPRQGHAAGTPFSVTLQQGDVYQLADLGHNFNDLTGTIVEANRPVAVYGGHRSTTVPYVAPAQDYLLEAIPPVSTWGRHYFTNRFGTQPSDTLRILGAVDGTSVDVTTYRVLGGPITQSYTVNRGGFVQLLFEDGPTEITASQPVLVERNVVARDSVAVLRQEKNRDGEGKKNWGGLAGNTGEQ